MATQAQVVLGVFAAGFALAFVGYLNRQAVGEVVDAAVDLLKPRGIRNNNPGNLVYIPDPARAWDGQIGSDGRFGVYDTAARGVRALGKQLEKHARSGMRTVRTLINVWAPPSENNTGAYVAQVAKALNVAPDLMIDVSARLPQLAAAIIQHENGRQPYAMADIERWVRLE